MCIRRVKDHICRSAAEHLPGAEELLVWLATCILQLYDFCVFLMSATRFLFMLLSGNILLIIKTISTINVWK